MSLRFLFNQSELLLSEYSRNFANLKRQKQKKKLSALFKRILFNVFTDRKRILFHPPLVSGFRYFFLVKTPLFAPAFRNVPRPEHSACPVEISSRPRPPRLSGQPDTRQPLPPVQPECRHRAARSAATALPHPARCAAPQFRHQENRPYRSALFFSPSSRRKYQNRFAPANDNIPVPAADAALCGQRFPDFGSANRWQSDDNSRRPKAFSDLEKRSVPVAGICTDLAP